MKDKSKFTILVVDDEEIIRKFLVYNYKLEGYKVISASNGQDALEICKSQNVNFIITDVKMSKGDGIFLLDEINKIDFDKPAVVMMTGFSELTKEEVRKKGALDILDKPFSFESLDKYIEDHLNITVLN